MKPRVHDLGDAFAERNMFLQVGLGLISLCLGFEELVAAQGGLLRPDAADGAEEGHRLAAQETTPVLRLQGPERPLAGGGPAGPVLDFVLGVAAFSQRLLRHAEEASATPPPMHRDAGDRRDRLRGLLA